MIVKAPIIRVVLRGLALHLGRGLEAETARRRRPNERSITTTPTTNPGERI